MLRPLSIHIRLYLICFELFFLTITSTQANIKSITGKIEFSKDNSANFDMKLDNKGLAIGPNMSAQANLHVSGNAVITGNTQIGSSITPADLHLSGGLHTSFQHFNSSGNLSSNTYILANSSSNTLVLHLPDATDVSGRIYNIKKTTEDNAVWLFGGASKIDGIPAVYINNDDDFVKVLSDGEQWYIVNNFKGRIASDNLVGYWTMDSADLSSNTIRDLSGYGHDATVTNMATSNISTSAKIGQGMNFDGTNDYMVVNNASPLYEMSQFSVCAWINTRSNTNLEFYC